MSTVINSFWCSFVKVGFADKTVGLECYISRLCGVTFDQGACVCECWLVTRLRVNSDIILNVQYNYFFLFECYPVHVYSVNNTKIIKRVDCLFEPDIYCCQ